LKNEPTELLLARIAYAEAAVFSTGGTGEDFMGGVVFEDARLITWIVRLGALMGLPNYGSSFTAGLSTSIQDVILDPDEYQPITDLIASLTGSGANCDPTQFGTSVADNVKRMVFPVNSELRQVVELFELWRIYQTVISDAVVTAPWASFPATPFNLRGFEAFKGVAFGLSCPQTGAAQGLSRPGPGLTWAANQPYPPRAEGPYLHPVYGSKQAFKTCYQDTKHLDDLMWAGLTQTTPDLGAPLPNGFASNTFVKQFPVVKLKNPADCADTYPLAQLTGKNGMPWPVATTCP
jgi:hypothetical protein